MRDCLSCEFHSRPRGRHSDSSRRPLGGRSKNGGIGLAFKPAGAGGDFTGRTGGNNSRAKCLFRLSRNQYGCPGTRIAVGCDDPGGYTNNVRIKRGSPGCSRAASRVAASTRSRRFRHDAAGGFRARARVGHSSSKFRNARHATSQTRREESDEPG